MLIGFYYISRFFWEFIKAKYFSALNAFSRPLLYVLESKDLVLPGRQSQQGAEKHRKRRSSFWMILTLSVYCNAFLYQTGQPESIIRLLEILLRNIYFSCLVIFFFHFQITKVRIADQVYSINKLFIIQSVVKHRVLLFMTSYFVHFIV